jgi:hypothetical protein
MGHSISVYLIRKEELRTDKIESIIEDTSIGNIKFKELDGGVLAATHIPNIKEFGKDKTIAKIETNYFGGSGNQSAKLFINNNIIYHKDDEFDFKCSPINDVLKLMNVKCKEGMDLFDTIGLGRYRSNKDFK